MKKSLIIFFTLINSLPIFSQNIVGQWDGNLLLGKSSLRIVFNISENNGKLISTMDSPDQGAKGIPVTETSFQDGLITMRVASAGLTYTGTIDPNDENKIVGSFTQMGQTFTLNLNKNTNPGQLTGRPQDPVKPYEYYTENVSFNNVKDRVQLVGTLSMPKRKGKFKAIILISGSGPQNRNEELLDHRPFLVISDFLTKQGYAVLRFDDRGTAESTGSFDNATTFDFANDVNAAIDYLKTRKEIIEIGLMGHSEGGLIAPIVASQRKDVSFIILLAGTGLKGDKLLLEQQQLIGKANGFSDKELLELKELNENVFKILDSEKSLDKKREELQTYFSNKLANEPDSLNPNGLSDENLVQMFMSQYASVWMVTFLSIDPAFYLEQVKCPVLALNGSFDLQVPPKENLAIIEKSLQKAGNQNFSIIEIPKLNHLFQECETGSPNEYAKIPQTFSPIALDIIATWLKNLP